MTAAYLRHPAVVGDQLIVAADDDLWIGPLSGGRAARVTDGRAPASHPVPSPDGLTLAFTGLDSQHPEAHVMPLAGGPARRLSHLGGSMTVTSAWDHRGRVVIASNAGLPFSRDSQLLGLDPADGHAEPLGLGTAHEIAFGAGSGTLVGRHTTNQGRWKRYRGGTAGQLWLRADGSDTFVRLVADLDADIGSPMLIDDRAYFIADHDGVGNIYSCDLAGGDLVQHTRHDDFYARFASTDGRTIVYTCGGDVFALQPAAESPTRVDIGVHSPRTARSTTFVPAAKWLQSYDVHPDGTHVAARIRGQAFVLPLHDGPARQVGQRAGANHRLISWLGDGDSIVLLSDASGEERLEIHDVDGNVTTVGEDLGVPLELQPAPVGSSVALSDQQGRLRVVDLAAPDAPTVIDVVHSPYGVDNPAWSSDGRWLAYSERTSNWYTARIAIWDSHNPSDPPRAVSPGTTANRAPSFDPDGRYLYWIAGTRFFPVNDGMYFDRAFPHPDVVVACVLREDGPAPLYREARSPAARQPRPPDRSADGHPGATSADPEQDIPDEQPARPGNALQVDVQGLCDRIVTLPFPTGRYRSVVGLQGKVLALAVPLRPPPLPFHSSGEPPPGGQLEVLSLDTTKHEVIVPRVTSFAVSADRGTMVYAVKKRLRAVRAGVKPPEGAAADGPARVSGWVDLGRVSVQVDPPAEWRQLFDESWRLQRDLFWHSDMSGVDWPTVRTRYGALLDRISTRAELTDLLWEMFGELGTGHAYVRGGDHPVPPKMPVGFLGADLRRDEEGWSVGRILRCESTDPLRRQPLRAPGVRAGEGDRILAVDGVPVGPAGPTALLVNRSDTEVSLQIGESVSAETRTVTVHTLGSEQSLRYADWVIGNRDHVAARSDGRVGYVHVPDMAQFGYAEFHRQYLSQADAQALVVDVRFNGGGNVSSLILEKLAGRRIGYQMRRSGALEPYPHHAPAGPLVAVTNERCGSDGDIFTHAWKRLELGPVVGTRTWGGVVGIQPRFTAADGMVTTQPAFAFWFDDVGWAVENFGTEPTHTVHIAPHDALAGRDTQLDAAIDLAAAALDSGSPGMRPAPPD